MTRHPPQPARSGSEIDLFCLPWAGGGASAYSDWQRGLEALSARVRVRPVQLPGREERSQEPRHTDLDLLVEELDEELDTGSEAPYLLYGHGMGALTSHALALRRQRRGARLPEALILSSHRAPHIPPNRLLDPEADDEKLAVRLAELGGVPWELAGRRRFRDDFMPLIRDDLRLCSGWIGPDEIEPLRVPLHLFVGERDQLVPVYQMAAWTAHGASGSTLLTMPGGHFFMRSGESEMLRQLAAVIARYGSAPAT
ncbi:thioesterase II family protein [Streptomyces goshikiensis]|uniref:thioesterase II family protein n=1 Tax=Streptomyces goshikiensis TaxID=1942 RepID=UPI0036ABE881